MSPSTSRAYLPHISRTSPLHLPHISATSPLYLQVCEAAQDELRQAALPQPVMDAAKVELAAQRKVALQDVEVCCYSALRGEGRH